VLLALHVNLIVATLVGAASACAFVGSEPARRRPVPPLVYAATAMAMPQHG
jgi:hypothetical protein